MADSRSPCRPRASREANSSDTRCTFDRLDSIARMETTKHARSFPPVAPWCGNSWASRDVAHRFASIFHSLYVPAPFATFRQIKRHPLYIENFCGIIIIWYSCTYRAKIIVFPDAFLNERPVGSGICSDNNLDGCYVPTSTTNSLSKILDKGSWIDLLG